MKLIVLFFLVFSSFLNAEEVEFDFNKVVFYFVYSNVPIASRRVPLHRGVMNFQEHDGDLAGDRFLETSAVIELMTELKSKLVSHNIRSFVVEFEVAKDLSNFYAMLVEDFFANHKDAPVLDLDSFLSHFLKLSKTAKCEDDTHVALKGIWERYTLRKVRPQSPGHMLRLRN